MINTKLFTIGNVLVIVAVAAVTHMLAKPIYAAIDG